MQKPIFHGSLKSEDGGMLGLQVMSEVIAAGGEFTVVHFQTGEKWWPEWKRKLDKAEGAIVLFTNNYEENFSKHLKAEGKAILKKMEEDESFRLYIVNPDKGFNAPMVSTNIRMGAQYMGNVETWKTFVTCTTPIDDDMPKKFTLESERFPGFYVQGIGKRGYHDYVWYCSGGSDNELYQVGPNTRFQIMNKAKDRYLHTDSPYSRWRADKPAYYFTWKGKGEKEGGDSCEHVISNGYGTGRSGELVELWSSKDLQVGSASNSHNVLCYPHYDWTGNNYRYGAWHRVMLENGV